MTRHALKPSMGFWMLFFIAIPTQFLVALEVSAQSVSVSTAPGTNYRGFGGDLPPYDYQIENGLLATVTALNFDKPDVRNEKSMSLKKVEGCAKDMEVQVMWQNGQAPLAVLLLGFTSRSKSPMAQIWKSQLYASGCHVMTMDSPFLPSFNRRSRHGVAGNLEMEAQLAGNVIAAFLKTNDAKAKVTKFGIVGGSYGAYLALNIASMAKAGKIPVIPERVLALSPPVKVKTAADMLDKFHREDRWNYELTQLAGDLQGLTPAKGLKANFPDSELRAGIAAAFRLDLSEITLYTDEAYKLKILPYQNDTDDSRKASYADAWTFNRYLDEMCYPYWQSKGKVNSLQQLMDMGDVRLLIQKAPEGVLTVIADDDPMNDPAELAVLKASVPSSKLIVLPRGGHMGYISSKWSEALIQSLFK